MNQAGLAARKRTTPGTTYVPNGLERVSPVIRLAIIICFAFGAAAACTLAAKADSPLNITTDIPWIDTGGGYNPFTGEDLNTYNGVVDIEAAFNHARRQEEIQLGLAVGALGNLSLPTQAAWDAYSDDQKATAIINAERATRLGMTPGVIGLPFTAVQVDVDNLAQNHADYLVTANTTGHIDGGGKNPFQRISSDPVLGSCYEFLNRAENIAYFWSDGASNPLYIARAIYNWIYADAGDGWGHRETVLLQDKDVFYQDPDYGFNNNVGSAADEGYFGIGVAESATYNPNGYSGGNWGTVVVFDMFDPISTGSCPWDETTNPDCAINAGNTLDIDDDKIEWKFFNGGDTDVTIESIEIVWPAELGAIDKVKLDGDEIVKDDIAPSAAVITSFEGDLHKRQIEAGKEAKLKFEFRENFKNTTNADYTIRVTFAEGCTVDFAPSCEASGAHTLKIEDDKIEWQLFNDGDEYMAIERIEVTWPAALGAIEKVKLDGGEIVKTDIAPSAAVITAFEGDLNKRTINDGDDRKLKFEFANEAPGLIDVDFTIRVDFIEGCSVEFTPGAAPSGTFACEKPLDQLSMIWDGSPTAVRIKAWKDEPGEQPLADVDNITSGTKVTISGYAPKDGNDVIWEIFAAGTEDKLGESIFHMSCSDDEMDGPEDCGARQGDGKGKSGYMNDWLLAGMVDAAGVLECAVDQQNARQADMEDDAGQDDSFVTTKIFLPIAANQ